MKPEIRKRARNGVLVALALLDLAGWITGTMTAFVIAATLLLGGYGLFALARVALRRSKLIWRVRNRLIVTYVFISIVPIALILLLAFFGTWIVAG